MLRDLGFAADVSEIDWVALYSAADQAGCTTAEYILRVAMRHPEVLDQPDQVEAVAALAVDQAHEDLRRDLGAVGYAAAMRAAETIIPKDDEVRAFYARWTAGVRLASV